jgi:hypothetical protein
LTLRATNFVEGREKDARKEQRPQGEGAEEERLGGIRMQNWGPPPGLCEMVSRRVRGSREGRRQKAEGREFGELLCDDG